MNQLVAIRELTGWGFDIYPHRPEVPYLRSLDRTATLIADRAPFAQSDPVVMTQNDYLTEAFARYAERSDLIAEMSGLSWSMGVIDLRHLLAFQRRLTFSPDVSRIQVPAPNDWAALLKLSFGIPKAIEYDICHDTRENSLVLRSSNPNLHVRVTEEPTHPLLVHGGGPFFEVARFCERWFLRDGYHRAYELLQAGVHLVPSLIVAATTLEELGADRPWFFPETVLLSETPPRVTDFLDDDLVLQYDRPPFIKTLRIKFEETLEPQTFTGEPS